MADEGAAVVADGVAPAWTGAAACWAGWAGLLIEVELDWAGAVVTRKRDGGGEQSHETSPLTGLKDNELDSKH